MTNWENEINSAVSRQQENLVNNKLREIDNLKKEQIMRYETEILPAFELLDKLNVRDSLEEIKNQIWGKGEIYKSINSLDEYLLKGGGADYTLKSPTYLEYRQVNGGWQDDYWEIGEKYDSLIVSVVSKTLYINQNKISISQDLSITSKLLKDELIKDCIDRKSYRTRDYGQMTNSAIQNHPILANQFFRENPKWGLYQPPKTKRSFLDKLFG